MSNIVVPNSVVDLAAKQSGKFVRPQIEPRLTKEFKIIKQQMLKEFNTHQVTMELEQKTAADPSSFVSSGSLFGFIGFDSSDEPTEIVREMLSESELKFIRFNGAIIDYKVFYPSKEELFDATPLPWAAGRSWLKGIESGLSGLGQYLNLDDSEYSRSGGGIQSEYKVRSGRFKATSYISKILNNFIKKINELSI